MTGFTAAGLAAAVLIAGLAAAFAVAVTVFALGVGLAFVSGAVLAAVFVVAVFDAGAEDLEAGVLAGRGAGGLVIRSLESRFDANRRQSMRSPWENQLKLCFVLFLFTSRG